MSRLLVIDGDFVEDYELMVPVHVLQLGAPIDPAWGPARPIASARDLGKALKAVRDSLERQRLAWVEGEVLPSALALEARDDGIRLAGRGPSSD